MASHVQKLLSEALTKNAYHFPETIEAKFVEYLALLDRWNQVFNLTAIRDPEDMVWLHILDSLSISPYLQGSRMIDVGTGAGLPGIPLALAHSDKQFVLLDSNSKKTRFLTQTLLALQIKNVEVVHARCEDFNPEVGFDSILSRAFSSIQVMLSKTQHLLAQDGRFLAMKGVYPAQEIKEIPAGFTLLESHKLKIKGLAAERHVICIEKK